MRKKTKYNKKYQTNLLIAIPVSEAYVVSSQNRAAWGVPTSFREAARKNPELGRVHDHLMVKKT